MMTGSGVTARRYDNILCLTETASGWTAKRQSLRIRDGRIVGCTSSPSTDLQPDELRIDGTQLMAMPGLVNAHTHSPDNLSRGCAGDLPLELWSLASSAPRTGRSPRDIHVSTMLGALEMASTGTTCVVDHVRISPDISAEGLDAVAQAWLDSGLRVVIAPVVSDLAPLDTMPFVDADFTGLDRAALTSAPPLPWHDQMEIVAAFHDRWHGAEGRITVGIGPSGPQRCSDILLRAAATFSADHNVPFHCHVLETSAQRQMGWERYGKGMVAHLDDLGCLTPRTHLVHSIWLEPGDAELIAARGAAVIHNPVSNARLGSGTCPLPALLDAGVRVALGTDSACCNDSNNMLETMKWAALRHNEQGRFTGIDRALSAATSKGAEILGLGGVCGRIAPGMAADIAVFSLNAPAFVPLNNAPRQLVLAESGAALDHVLVAGRVVWSSGDHGADAPRALWAEAREIATAYGQTPAAAKPGLDLAISRMLTRVTENSANKEGTPCH